MDRFIGRKDDLQFLEEYYETPGPRAVAIVGRRRIGKTLLIKEFIRDKDHLYFQFLDSTMEANIRNLETRMGRQLGKNIEFDDSVGFFDELKNVVLERKYVIVFDEYPFMSAIDSSFSSLLQGFIDHDMKESKVIISGSSIGMMEQEIEDYSRPLFGRVHKYVLGPMSITDCREFHPNMSNDDQMRMYLTFGGMPMYYDFPDTSTYGIFMDRYVLKKNALLCQEGESMIRREFLHSEEFIAILDMIAAGHDTVAELTNVTKFDRSTVNHHVNRLREAGMIETLRPMAGANAKSVRYRIRDRMLAFHHHVIRRFVQDSTNMTYDELKEQISTFLGRMFEMQCAEYVKERFVVKDIGMWYGRIPKRDRNGVVMKDDAGKTITQETDIDIVAYVKNGTNTVELYGECKFTGQPMNMGDVKSLVSRMENANVGANNRMIFFSRYGFDDKMAKYAEENSIILVELTEMTDRPQSKDCH